MREKFLSVADIKYVFIGVLGVCKKVTKYVKLFCK